MQTQIPCFTCSILHTNRKRLFLRRMSVVTAARLVPIGKSSGGLGIKNAVVTHFGAWLANCLWTPLLRKSPLMCDPSRLAFRFPTQPRQQHAKCTFGLRTPSRTRSCCRWARGTHSAQLTEIKCCRKSEPTALAFFPTQQLATEIPTSFLGRAHPRCLSKTGAPRKEDKVAQTCHCEIPPVVSVLRRLSHQPFAAFFAL